MTRKSAASSTHWAPLGIAAVLIVACCAGFAVWWLDVRKSTTATSQTTPTTSTTTTSGQSAVAVSQNGLETLASLGRPIYWAGAKPADTYELTQDPDGRVYLRYLPPGTPVGSSKIFLTVASYPVAGAFGITRQLAHQAGAVQVPVAHGGTAFYRSRLPTNIYLAYPGSDYQIEVFDPSPSEARQLVSGGGIVQVKGEATGATVPKTAAVAVSPGQLAQLATRLGRPLYWAGKESGQTYELTQTPDGRVYVRYLPAGIGVGSLHPYLTIGTYPLANGYAITRSASKQHGAVLIPIPGGIAFYQDSRPTSVYMAFPGVDEQIEVYDPSASLVRSTVAHHLIHSVSP